MLQYICDSKRLTDSFSPASSLPTFLMEFVWRTISFSLTGIKRQGQELLVNFPFGWGLLAGPAVSLCFSHQSFTVATPCPPQPFCCFQFLKITKPYFCLSHAFEFFLWQGLALSEHQHNEKSLKIWAGQDRNGHESKRSTQCICAVTEGKAVWHTASWQQYRNRQWKEGSGKCEGGEAAVNFQNEAGWREVGKTENECEKAAGFLHAADSAYRNNSLNPIHLYQPT